VDENRPAGRIDWVNVALVLAAGAVLGYTAWLRYGPKGPGEPPGVGQRPPALGLLDVRTREPLVLVGLRGRVVWISFLAADSPTQLAGLEGAWKRLSARRGFAMVAAAVEGQGGARSGDRLRANLEKSRSALPVYLATDETLRRFGTRRAKLPLHILVDENGRVGAVAQGEGGEVFARLVGQAERWLDELEPLGPTRFAQARTRSVRFPAF
jgi:hypothetical protein